MTVSTTLTAEDETLPPAVMALLAAGQEPFAERQRHLKAEIDESRRQLLKGILAELRDEPGFDPLLAAYLTDVKHEFNSATAVVTLELPGCCPIDFTLSRRATGGEWKLVRQGEILKMQPLQGVYYHTVEGGFRVRLGGSDRPTALNSLAVAAAAARECYRDFSIESGPPAHGCVTTLATTAGDIDREAARLVRAAAEAALIGASEEFRDTNRESFAPPPARRAAGGVRVSDSQAAAQSLALSADGTRVVHDPDEARRAMDSSDPTRN